MNYNNQAGSRVRTQAPVQAMAAVPGEFCAASADSCGGFSPDRFPVGMGYVPIQRWEMPYPLNKAFMRGTIFQSLDYPFMRGCR